MNIEAKPKSAAKSRLRADGIKPPVTRSGTGGERSTRKNQAPVGGGGNNLVGFCPTGRKV